MQKSVKFVKKSLKINIWKIKYIVKLEINVIIQGNIEVLQNSICNLKYSVSKVFNKGLNYDYHFIKKELAKEFKKQFTCLGENTEKYITFTVPIEKEVIRINKKGEEVTKIISYILRFIDSARFMASPLSNLVNNLSEGIYRTKCKFGHNDKKCKTCGIK